MTALPDVGMEVPTQVREPSAQDLFMFSGASWLLHRIHYDAPFTREHEGHPALLIHGPLQGVYMIQAAEAWLGAVARVESISYRHKSPAYLGDRLECGGRVTSADKAAVEIELWARKSDGTITTTGTARLVAR